MDSVLYSAARQWAAEQHLQNVLDAGEWVPMFDSNGNRLPGIRGKRGAGATKIDGTEIGADLIEMQPGSAFPLHVHDGDHVLYVESGTGAVHIDGENRQVKKGDTIFIAAEYPHGVVGPAPTEQEPLVIIAFGHPHKHVGSHDRMKHPPAT